MEQINEMLCVYDSFRVHEPSEKKRDHRCITGGAGQSKFISDHHLNKVNPNPLVLQFF